MSKPKKAPKKKTYLTPEEATAKIEAGEAEWGSKPKHRTSAPYHGWKLFQVLRVKKDGKLTDQWLPGVAYCPDCKVIVSHQNHFIHIT